MRNDIQKGMGGEKILGCMGKRGNPQFLSNYKIRQIARPIRQAIVK